MPGLGDGGGAPQSVRVRFGTLDIGTDDCEDIFSFGDFSVRESVMIQPQNDDVFALTRSRTLGSAACQATVQSIDLNVSRTFELRPVESFEVRTRVTKDDPINSDEPQPRSESESFDYLTITSRSASLVNGPGCFRDDRIDISISVTE